MKTLVAIKVDKEVKELAQDAAREIGIPLSTIVNAYLKQFGRERQVRFVVGEKMTPKLEKRLSTVDADIKKGKNLSPAFSSMKDAIGYLHS